MIGGACLALAHKGPRFANSGSPWLKLTEVHSPNRKEISEILTLVSAVLDLRIGFVSPRAGQQFKIGPLRVAFVIIEYQT